MEIKELQEILLARADGLRSYIDRKIPARHRSLLSADDVLQEVWIAAHQAAPVDVRDKDRWLTALANSKLIDALRALRALKRGGGKAAIRDAPSPSSSVDGLLARICGDLPTPSRELSIQEARNAAQVAIAGLKAETRDAVAMRYAQGLSHDVIAERMGKSKPAVNSLLFRGLRELRERMGDAARFFSGSRVLNARASRDGGALREGDENETRP